MSISVVTKWKQRSIFCSIFFFFLKIFQRFFFFFFLLKNKTVKKAPQRIDSTFWKINLGLIIISSLTPSSPQKFFPKANKSPFSIFFFVLFKIQRNFKKKKKKKIIIPSRMKEPSLESCIDLTLGLLNPSESILFLISLISPSCEKFFFSKKMISPFSWICGFFFV